MGVGPADLLGFPLFELAEMAKKTVGLLEFCVMDLAPVRQLNGAVFSW